MGRDCLAVRLPDQLQFWALPGGGSLRRVLSCDCPSSNAGDVLQPPVVSPCGRLFACTAAGPDRALRLLLADARKANRGWLVITSHLAGELSDIRALGTAVTWLCQGAALVLATPGTSLGGVPQQRLYRLQCADLPDRPHKAWSWWRWAALFALLAIPFAVLFAMVVLYAVCALLSCAVLAAVMLCVSGERADHQVGILHSDRCSIGGTALYLDVEGPPRRYAI